VRGIYQSGSRLAATRSRVVHPTIGSAPLPLRYRASLTCTGTMVWSSAMSALGLHGLVKK
jgi:hypothetical protein